MTQEEKDLLLKDLSARLPYGVKVAFSVDDYAHDLITIDTELLKAVRIKGKRPGSKYDRGPEIVGMWTYIKNIKPYLFPMSSMTEEQSKEFYETFHGSGNYDWTIETFDWLNANHFDYRGLIPKGLAIDATGLNIY